MFLSIFFLLLHVFNLKTAILEYENVQFAAEFIYEPVEESGLFINLKNGLGKIGNVFVQIDESDAAFLNDKFVSIYQTNIYFVCAITVCFVQFFTYFLISIFENRFQMFLEYKLYENEICPLCLKNFCNISIVKCNHKFHEQCLFSIINRNSCPICRQTISI